MRRNLHLILASPDAKQNNIFVNNDANVGPRLGGLVVSVHALFSDDPSSHPAEAYSFSVKHCLKRKKIKRGSGLPICLLTYVNIFVSCFLPIFCNDCFELFDRCKYCIIR